MIELKEIGRPGRTDFAAARYRVPCCGVERGKGRAGQNGFGLAVKESIIVKVTWTQVLFSGCLVSTTLSLSGRSNADTFVIAHAPTDTSKSGGEGETHTFGTESDSTVNGVPNNHPVS